MKREIILFAVCSMLVSPCLADETRNSAADSVPIVEIGAGAKIYGPVSVRSTMGEIVFAVPKGGYVITDSKQNERN